MIAEIHSALGQMGGIRGFSSLIDASVVRSEQDEILVMPFLPEGLIEDFDEGEARDLKAQYPDFPEIHPYLSADFRATAFYVEPGLSVSSHPLVAQIDQLRARTRQRYGFTFDFTGMRAIRVYTERYMTQDVLRMLPFLGLLVSLLYFALFRSWRMLLVAWLVKLLATASAFGCYFLIPGATLSPLVVLVPVFNIGLLSDYLIHVFYHIRGASGLASNRETQRYLLLPLSLTALTSIIGFSSLWLLGESGHALIATVMSLSILLAYLLTVWWIPTFRWGEARGRVGEPPDPISRLASAGLTRTFLAFYRVRWIAIPIYIAILGVSVTQLPHLAVEAYPLKQLPPTSTIRKAETLLNQKFSGTVPFSFLIDSRESEAFLDRGNLLRLDAFQQGMLQAPETGYEHSILSILERINYYFHNGDPRFLAIPNATADVPFGAVVEQYLLFYSASASPEEYEALIDADYRTVSIQGILRYRDDASLETFLSTYQRVRTRLPAEWKITLAGPLEQLVATRNRIRSNWYLSFGAGTLLIFLVVLIFFRNLKMSLLSLLPSFSILLMVTGVSPLLGIGIDEYTVIVVAITTGLTIDYTIHILNAVRALKTRLPQGSVTAYASVLTRKGGLPVFASFLTSLFAFATLSLSSFTGAVHFAAMLCLAVASAFLISFLILPLFFYHAASARPGGPDSGGQA
jgi:predicted RND superfamily exporter protein